MSDAAIQLIDAFTALPARERNAVFIELARISEVDAEPMTDDDLTAVGNEIFMMYDREEAAHGDSETR